MATVGEDIGPYLERLQRLGIDATLLKKMPAQFTAQAFITTDLDNNQIIAFHPGAMNSSHENHVRRELEAGVAIIGPDGKLGMQQHARECAELGVPFMFDPGQGLPMFSGEEIEEFLRHATYVAVNDYEGKMLEEKTGCRLEELARRVKTLIVTLGAQGSLIFSAGKRHEIPSAKADKVADPTGCGDAYRAGLLYGISRGWDWPNTGKLAAVMGAIKIAHGGAQNHTPSREEIEARFRSAFGHSPWSG
jgi:adenosine kinase